LELSFVAGFAQAGMNYFELKGAWCASQSGRCFLAKVPSSQLNGRPRWNGSDGDLHLLLWWSSIGDRSTSTSRVQLLASRIFLSKKKRVEEIANEDQQKNSPQIKGGLKPARRADRLLVFAESRIFPGLLNRFGKGTSAG
jgi:hypothetical protein